MSGRSSTSCWNARRLGTTGVGSGIAIPHGKTGRSEVHSGPVRAARPSRFEDVDEQPVDLVFLLLAPGAPGKII